MDVMYKIQDMIEEELNIIAKKPEMSASDIECTYKLIDILKDITTIDAMREGGYSQEGSYDDMNMRYSGRGNSYRRGRDAMGRYTSRDSYRDGYSGHNKTSMIEDLRELMDDAKNDMERDSIRRVIDILNK